ncbi:MAG: DUF1549 domain-containing protein [Planctomycetes bacterium]|nr:DUF1549 domain-containing protein [Planctomycetota bacterium]
MLTGTAAGKLFTRDILPLLRKRCFGCHGDGKKREAKLDLRTRSGMLKGGESGTALVPGHPGKSRIFRSVLRTGKLVMPPKDRNRLTKSQIAQWRAWIAAGAPWPAAVIGKDGSKRKSAAALTSQHVTVATSGGLSADWTNRKYDPADLWAYRPLKRYPVPRSGRPGAEIRHPIDAFIQSKLRMRKWQSAPPAKKRTLLRRVTFDLTGLPPGPDDLRTFLRDKSPRAYRQVVARLLRSAHYGEQQARHWLDVVRYADTGGFSNDFERANAWRYRDYVIRSFNKDKPFDRFIVEQIAGDELDADDKEMLIAVGFLRMGPWEHTGMSVAAVTRKQFLDDVTHSVGVTFLAQGLRCARCHDHKFDPIPTRDYYRMQAVFAPLQFADRTVPYRPDENTSSFKTTQPRVKRQLKASRDFLASLRQKHNRAIADFLQQHGYRRLIDVPEKLRPKRHYGLTLLEMSLNKIHRKRIDYFEREMKRYRPLAFSVYNGPTIDYRSNKTIHALPSLQKRRGDIPPIRILGGGSLAAPGARVSPGPTASRRFRRRSGRSHGSCRRSL